VKTRNSSTETNPGMITTLMAMLFIWPESFSRGQLLISRRNDLLMLSQYGIEHNRI